MLVATCSYIPLEIPLSLNIPAKRLFPDVPRPFSESYLPRDFCPYVKAVFGHVMQLRKAHAQDVFIAVAGSCDAMRRLYDLLKFYCDKNNVYYIDVPRTRDEHAVSYYAFVLKRFARNLLKNAYPRFSRVNNLQDGRCPKAIVSRDIAWLEKNLRGTIEFMNSVRAELKQSFFVSDPQQAPDSSESLSNSNVAPLFSWYKSNMSYPATTFTEVLLEINDYLGRSRALDAQNAAELVRAFVLRASEVNTAGTREAGSDNFKPTVFVIGTFFLDGSVVKSIEKCGFKVAFLDSCLGFRNVSFTVPTEGDIFKNLARAYLTKIPCPRMLAAHERTNALKSFLERYKDVKGVIYFVPKFCDLGYYEFVEIKDFLREKEIPILFLEGDFGTGKRAQVKTRLMAFKELMEQRFS